MKPKNTTNRRANAANVIVIALAAIIAPIGIYFWFVLQTGQQPELFESSLPDIPPANTVETLVIPFDRAEPTLTENEYSSTITLVVEGSGQAVEIGYSDAFYRYTNSSGIRLEEPQLTSVALEIDGEEAVDFPNIAENPPDYSPLHIYEFMYNVGTEPRQIAFRVSDDDFDDNTGQFRVFITSPLNPLSEIKEGT